MERPSGQARSSQRRAVSCMQKNWCTGGEGKRHTGQGNRRHRRQADAENRTAAGWPESERHAGEERQVTRIRGAQADGARRARPQGQQPAGQQPRHKCRAAALAGLTSRHGRTHLGTRERRQGHAISTIPIAPGRTRRGSRPVVPPDLPAPGSQRGV